MKATDKICNRTYKALQLLYKNARDQQYNFLIGKQYPSIYSLGYKKEFCTIRICTARQTGHTTAILKFIANKKDTLRLEVTKQKGSTKFDLNWVLKELK